MLIVGYSYMIYAKQRHPKWFGQNQMISTAAMTCGTGLAGIMVLIYSFLKVQPVGLAGGQWGAYGNGCEHLPIVDGNLDPEN